MAVRSCLHTTTKSKATADSNHIYSSITTTDMGLPPALHLYPHLRIHQVFGANTDVGKTIFTTALALASAALPWSSASENQIMLSREGALNIPSDGERVHYIKPISTGPIRDSDSLHIARYLSTVDAHTLFQFQDPVSPHVAVELYRKATGKTIDTSDGAVIHALSAKIASFAHASSRQPAAAYIETAGGVHSPAPSGTSFSALLRPLRLPTILIGDSNLGGISTTKSAFDSLSMAGYDIEALLLFSDAGRGWGNADYLTKWGAEVGLPVWALGGPKDMASLTWGTPPARSASISDTEDAVLMQRYYAGMVAGRGQEADADESALGMAPVITHLRQRHQNRIESLTTMAQRTRETCWWPFTQHMLAKSDADVNVIDSAHGDFFVALSQPRAEDETNTSLIRPLLDGSASWWTQCLGHADARLTQAAARASGRYGHVLFPMCANEPALRLSETLVGKTQEQSSPVNGVKRIAGTAPGKGWASRVFFSDDGSTGMEVALKMAIASSSARYRPRAHRDTTKARIEPGRQAGTMGGRMPREWMVLGLKGSYHGDTIGAMDASEPNVYNDRVDWYRGRGTWFEPPTVSMQNGKTLVTLPLQDEDWSTVKVDAQRSYDSIHDVYDVESRIHSDSLHGTYTNLIVAWLDRLTREQGHQYGALVLEPLIMGAGGMICVDPLFQRCLVDVVRAHPEMFSQSDPPLRTRATPTPVSSTTDKTWSGLPVVFDEVFTGLYRLGYSSPAQALGVSPDISVLAKILTGGMVPMSVTLASNSIFETFAQSDQKADALLHGHSYTAHPIGCEIASETLRTIEGMRQGGEWDDAVQDWSRASTHTLSSPSVWSFWSFDAVQRFSCLDGVESAMALGTVLILHLRDASGAGGYSSSAAVDMLQHLRTTSSAGEGHQLAFNIHARPLGNVVYVMSSLNTPAEVLRKTEEALFGALMA